MRLKVIDQISDPGEPGKPNDDALAHGDAFAAVFDGATSLTDEPIFPDAGSDAAWLAHLAAAQFAGAPANLPVAELVAGCCRHARAAVSAVVSLDSLPAWAWPSSSFQMIRLLDRELEISGLGDSVFYLLAPDRRVSRYSPVPASREAEIRAARRALQQAGSGAGPLVRRGPVLETQRAARTRQNGGGGMWLLGLVPEAADHIRPVRVEAVPGARLLLATDGFAALGEDYRRYEPALLLEAAVARGLASLVAELRHIERNEDPAGERFPRFKRSDDATAILAEIVE